MVNKLSTAVHELTTEKMTLIEKMDKVLNDNKIIISNTDSLLKKVDLISDKLQMSCAYVQNQVESNLVKTTEERN